MIKLFKLTVLVFFMGILTFSAVGVSFLAPQSNHRYQENDFIDVPVPGYLEISDFEVYRTLSFYEMMLVLGDSEDIQKVDVMMDSFSSLLGARSSDFYSSRKDFLKWCRGLFREAYLSEKDRLIDLGREDKDKLLELMKDFAKDVKMDWLGLDRSTDFKGRVPEMGRDRAFWSLLIRRMILKSGLVIDLTVFDEISEGLPSELVALVEKAYQLDLPLVLLHSNPDWVKQQLTHGAGPSLKVLDSSSFKVQDLGGLALKNSLFGDDFSLLGKFTKEKVGMKLFPVSLNDEGAFEVDSYVASASKYDVLKHSLELFVLKGEVDRLRSSFDAVKLKNLKIEERLYDEKVAPHLESGDAVRVISLNIFQDAHSWGGTVEERLDMIVREVAAKGCGVFTAQEAFTLPELGIENPDLSSMDNEADHTFGRNTADYIAEKLGFQVFHCRNTTRSLRSDSSKRGFEGVSILVHPDFEVLSSKQQWLTADLDYDKKRKILILELRHKKSKEQVTVASVHLSYMPREGEFRFRQAKEVVEVLKPYEATGPLILTGDFNNHELSDLTPFYEKGWVDSHEAVNPGSEGLTWVSENPMNNWHGPVIYTSLDRKVDYIFTLSPDGHGEGRTLGSRYLFTTPIDGIWASDHFAVMSDIQISPAMDATGPILQEAVNRSS